jgi:hypothetical protein
MYTTVVYVNNSQGGKHGEDKISENSMRRLNIL